MYYWLVCRANSFAERLRLGLAVIHGEPKEGEAVVDSRHSPPPQGEDEAAASATTSMEELGETPSRHRANLLSVVPKEKPPLNVVGDVHGKIAIIIVSCSVSVTAYFRGEKMVSIMKVSCVLQL